MIDTKGAVKKDKGGAHVEIQKKEKKLRKQGQKNICRDRQIRQTDSDTEVVKET